MEAKGIRQLLIGAFDKILYGFIYIWTGIYTRHAQHPRIGKFTFYLAVVYAVSLVVTLTHSYSSFKTGLYIFFPALKNASSEYTGHADNCSDWSIRNIMNCVDFFVFAHFIGYGIRGVVFRDLGFCWVMSITWEITEVAFRHLNPISFLECWWDAIILDILITNAIGIWFGMYMCKRLQLKMFKWDSNIVKHEDDGNGKERRRILSWQFSKCIGKESAFRRILPLSMMLIVSQIGELNLFFLKKLIRIPPGHPICLLRTYVISTMASPAVLEVYNCVTSGKKLGSSFFLWIGINCIEAAVCLKFGGKLFKKLNMTYMLYWVLIQVALCVVYLAISTIVSNRNLKASKNNTNDVEELNGITDVNKLGSHFQNGAANNGFAINIGETTHSSEPRQRFQRVGLKQGLGIPH